MFLSNFAQSNVMLWIESLWEDVKAVATLQREFEKVCESISLEISWKFHWNFCDARIKIKWFFLWLFFVHF